MANERAKRWIRAKIRKFQQYEKLLDDPDFISILPELQTALLNGAPSKDQLKLPVTQPKKKAGRRPGPLAEKAFKVVINAMREVSAKEVLTQLEAEGVSVKGKNKAVTVSKVLRQLARVNRISPRSSGPGKKAAILYRSNALAQSFPVQEKAVTQ
jgi:hypothetical protein